MAEFPRTQVEDVSLPRMLVGINWFLGFSHQTAARTKFIQEYQTPKRVADVMEVFVRAGVDAVYGVVDDRALLREAIADAQDRAGRKITIIALPHLETADTQEATDETARILDRQAEMGAAICLPHADTTDSLLDRRERTIRKMDLYCKMIRDRGMVPGLSTHNPETIVYADETDLDVGTYIQPYNAAGFLMHVEIDWVHRVITNARKPVIAIKPMAAGRLQPLVGLAFAWATLREQDMVCVGTLTPDEAKELIEISLSLLEGRRANVELQRTRSKASVEKKE